MSTPTATPRTDAFEIKAAHDAIEYGKTWQPMMFARTLETELARLRAQNDQFSDNLSAVGKAHNAEKDRAERAEAEVERLKGMRTAAEAIMTDVAEANEELAIARAEKAEAEAQLWHNRFASILWSGALNKHTGGDFQKWEAEFKAEQNALIARAEKAEMLLKQSPHWDTVAIIQNRDNYKEAAEKAEIALAEIDNVVCGKSYGNNLRDLKCDVIDIIENWKKQKEGY